MTCAKWYATKHSLNTFYDENEIQQSIEIKERR